MTESRPDDNRGEHVGAVLKEAREARNLSLDDVARVTRIGKGHLQAIEEEMFARLPSAVYARGFLRIYAAHLGLPEDEILRLYEKSIPDDHSSPECLEPRASGGHEKKVRSLSAAKSAYVRGAVFLLVAAAVAFCFVASDTFMGWLKGERAAVIPPSTTAGETVPAPERTTGAAADIQKKDAGENKGEEGGETKIAVPPSPAGLALKIRVIEDCWLHITIDDAVSQDYYLKPGDLIEWKGQKGFTLDIGNAGGIAAEFNGKAMKPFGRSGEVAHVTLKAGDS